MTTVYWWCLGGGFAATLLLFVIGDVLDGALDALDALDLGDFLDPLSFVGGLTLFGGAGLLLDTYTALPEVPAALVAGAIAVALSLVLHFAYVKPMKRSENSTGFSHAEYAGKTGELSTSLTATGFGEVVVRMGASTTFQTAASFDRTPIASGTSVVVVEVAPDGTLLVAPLSDAETSAPASAPRARLQTRA